LEASASMSCNGTFRISGHSPMLVGRRIASTECGIDFGLAISTDGLRYARLKTWPGTAGGWVDAALAPAGAGHWLLGGSGPGPTIWSSDDLVSWTTAALDSRSYGSAFAGTSSVSALALTPSGYVAVLDGRLTYVSSNGLVWRAANAPDPPDLSIGTIAVGPAGTLGFGHPQISIPDDRVDVWTLE